MPLKFATWASWFSNTGSGSNWKSRILPFTFSREVFQISAWKYLLCVQQEVFRVFIFPYFVLSWYILAQRLVKTFPKWKYFFSFSILKWHIIVQTNRNNKLFFKEEHSSNKAPFWGLHITCETYYNLSLKAENYQLDYSTSLM